MNKIWYKEAFIYHIYPLGMCGAPIKKEMNLKPESRLTQIFDWIDYWKELNVNAIYFGPIFESTSHGYDTIDYYNIDTRLGDNNLFINLVKNLNSQGIKTIIDGVFNHVSRDFPQFKDVLINKEHSKYCSWFYIDFNKKSNHGDPFYYEGWEGHYNLVKLNLKNASVKEYLFNAVKKWIKEFDISGIRLDVAYLLDKEFIKELKEFCLSLKDDFWIMGEIIHGDHRKWLDNNILDSTTNYECYKGIYSSHNDYNYFEISHSLNRLFAKDGIYKNHYLYNFVDNHDVDRIASTVKNQAHLYLIYILLFTIYGVPSIYYGSEIGIKGSKINNNDSQLRPKINFSDFKEMIKSNDLLKHIKNLSNIRVNNETLKYGSFEILFTSNKQLAFSRYDNNNYYIILLNMDDNTSTITLSNIEKFGTYQDLLNNNEEISLESNNFNVNVYPNWGRILKI
jgi:cyclomaltodextrinase